jgi:hypothetical protein
MMNLKGKRFGYLLVVQLDHKSKDMANYWLCKCDCGKEKLVQTSNLNSGRTQSCGCKKGELISLNVSSHGFCKTKCAPEYYAWSAIKQRCLNPKSKEYFRYGGRGIKVCARWERSFVNFIRDMGERPKGTSIERKNNNGNYEPSNCVWADKFAQANNTRKNRYIQYDEKRITVQQLANLTCIPYHILSYRIRHNWSVKKAITTPNRKESKLAQTGKTRVPIEDEI